METFAKESELAKLLRRLKLRVHWPKIGQNWAIFRSADSFWEFRLSADFQSAANSAEIKFGSDQKSAENRVKQPIRTAHKF